MKPSHARQRHASGAVRALGGGDDLARVEQLEIERRRQARMPRERRIGPHGVLVRAEGAQAMRDEVVERTRAHRRGSPASRSSRAIRDDPRTARSTSAKTSRVMASGATDGAAGIMPGPLAAETAAILGVEVPDAARGLRAVHQDCRSGGAFRDRRTPCAASPSRPPIRQSRRASRGSGCPRRHRARSRPPGRRA